MRYFEVAKFLIALTFPRIGGAAALSTQKVVIPAARIIGSATIPHAAFSAGWADEAHWDDFIRLIGAERVAPSTKTGVRSADYIWHDNRLIIELKNLVTDLTDHEGFSHKIAHEVEECAASGGDGADRDRRVANVIRSYLKDIIKSANSQIKHTKAEMQLRGYRGIVIIINTGFATLTAEAAEGCFRRIIASETQYRSICGVVYFEDLALHGKAIDSVVLIGNKRTTLFLEWAMLCISNGWLLYISHPELWFNPNQICRIKFSRPTDASKHLGPDSVKATIEVATS